MSVKKKLDVDSAVKILVRHKPKKRQFKSEATRQAYIEGAKKGQAKKGERRNIHGRPTGQTISEALKVIGRSECKIPSIVKLYGTGLSYNQVIAFQAATLAAQGNHTARIFITDRTEGSVPSVVLSEVPVESFLTDQEKAFVLDMLEKKETI